MKHFSVCLPLLLMLVSCAPRNDETTTKGHLHILVAEDVAPVMIPEVAEFTRLYQDRGAVVDVLVPDLHAGWAAGVGHYALADG